MTTENKATGYIWEAVYGWFDTGTGGFFPADHRLGLQPVGQHFANANTKKRFHELVEASEMIDNLKRLKVLPAEQGQLELVHSNDYIRSVREMSDAPHGGDAGDGSSPVGRGSYEIATLSSGGAIAAARAVATGEVQNAYALINPPGHHASRSEGMGFCLFNNVSVASASILEDRSAERIAIIDWDVHHGNGTQDIWWNDDRVLTISIHQDGNFPIDTGRVDEHGSRSAFGTNLNIPLPPGSGNAAYLSAMNSVIIPALERFQPDLIFVACGFDAGFTDPLARQLVTKAGFKKMAEAVKKASERICQGRLVFVQEGGYCPNYLPFCGLGVLEALTNVETKVGDPLGEAMGSQYGVAELLPHQEEAIQAAAESLPLIPERKD